jgi:hypothetical protein
MPGAHSYEPLRSISGSSYRLVASWNQHQLTVHGVSLDVFPKAHQAHRYRHRGHHGGDQCLRDRQPGFQQRRVRHRERGDGRATGQNQRVVGQVPQNWRPGTGTIITGAAANEAKAAALAKYPGGTVNRVLKLSDGSYAVHMIKISWPHHVFVSENFKVTGAIG